MPGFPNRPTRSAFGPKPKNRRPTRNPQQEMDAQVADLIMWQIAGLGVIAPNAWLLVPVATVNGVVAAGTIVHSESWNPDADQAGPVVTRTALGVLTVQYAATYNDKDGVAQATNLVWALPIPQGLGATAHIMIGSPTKVDARTFQVDLLRVDTMAHDDAAFALAIW